MLRSNCVLLCAFALIFCLPWQVEGGCPVGDVHLDSDCEVNWLDLQDFAAEWLNEGCSAPVCRADLHGASGVNNGDFAVLAAHWGEKGQITLVINELMADNGNTKEDPDEPGEYPDWIEIYNYGDGPIDMGGMYITDRPATPGSWWRIPSGHPEETTIKGGGYLLLWADEDPEQGPLHVDFKIAADGSESIGLYDWDGNLLDLVDFDAQAEDESWGRLPDGSDNWVGFGVGSTTPGSANRGRPIEVVINEIMYHPFHPENTAENVRLEYIELYNKGADPVSLAGWRFSDGIDFVIPAGVILGVGDYVVIASDVNEFSARYPSVGNVAGGWNGRLSNSGEDVELTDQSGVLMDKVDYSDEGEWAVRRLGGAQYGHRGWEWSDAHDGAGSSLELVNPGMPNEYGQNWSAGSGSGGSPGRVNSVYDADTAPLIIDAEHFPIIPDEGDTVTVTARIIDELGSGVSASVRYRIDRSTYHNGEEGIYPHHDANDYNDVTMFDDGGHGDGAAGDGVYGGVIPAQPDGAVVEFYVEASDSGGNSRTWPAPSTIDGAPEQVTNALYQVDNSFDWESWVAGTQPIYYLIFTENEKLRLLDIGDNDGGEYNSDAEMNATFVSVGGVDIKVRYRCGVRNRGHGSRNRPPNNYRVNFPRDRKWEDVESINLNTKNTYVQLVGNSVSRLSGLPQPRATAVQVRLNGENKAVFNSEMYGSYVHMEVVNDDFVQGNFPDDTGGDAYKCMRDAGPADWSYDGTNPDDYRYSYLKRTNSSEDDFSRLIQTCWIMDRAPDSNYVEAVEGAVNVENWLIYFALNTLMENNETSLANGYGDDYYTYQGIFDSRFVLVIHDLDSVFGYNGSSATRGIFRASNLSTMRRFIEHPEFVGRYYFHLKKLIETTFSAEQFNPLVDELLGDFVPAGTIQNIKNFVVRRNEHVLGLIPQEFSISSNLPVVSGYHRTTTSSFTLSGRANSIVTHSVQVNGQPTEWMPVDGRWYYGGAGRTLNPGVNRVVVQAFDEPNGLGNEVDRGFVDIWYDTGVTNDYPDGSVEPEGPVRLLVRDSYLAGIPVLVRVEAFGADEMIDHNLWDATAALSVEGNGGISLSENQVRLYNGRGSELVTFTGSGDFTLVADIGGVQSRRTLADLAGEPITVISAPLSGSATWEGVYYVTGGDFGIPAGATLTLEPGSLVLVDGTSTPLSQNGIDIDVAGSVNSLGTADRPVTITAANPYAPWGEIHHFGNASLYQYTNITRAGHSPHSGHTDKGPAIRVEGAALTFEHCSITDIAGKTMYANEGAVEFRDCLLSRSVMGPEIFTTSFLMEDSHIIEMLGIYREDGVTDDDDGFYAHSAGAGKDIRMVRSVVAVGDDDGVDTASAVITLEDVIIRDYFDKGISVGSGNTSVTGSIIVGNNIGIEAKDGGAITSIDRSTIVENVNGIRLMSSGESMTVTNSIIRGTFDSIFADVPGDMQISYSALGEAWAGTGNITGDPMFVSLGGNDYHLRDGSPCIDAGNPGSPSDPDGTRADMGALPFKQAKSAKAGDIVADELWTAAEGPYRITEELTIPSGVTLTIGAGVSIFFEPDTRMVVRGTLTAEGSEYESIRFTRTPGTTGSWGGLQFVDTGVENAANLISGAVLEYGETNDGMIGVVDSNLVVEHSTLDHTELRRIRTLDSSLIVRNCEFTDIFGPGEPPSTDNMSEHIWGRAGSTGRFIIENNVFGVDKGHNDAVDVDGPSRPSPIPQILNNTFLGSGDDAIDLESDAHIEGNRFYNIIKDEWNTASGEANVISAGAGKHYVMVRNLCYNTQHVAQVKDEAFLTFANNSVVDACEPAIYFDLGLAGRGPGRGADVDGSIFWGTPEIFAGVVGTTELTVDNSMLPFEWHGYGTGNIDADPLFMDEKSDFRLKQDSGAIGAGSWGLDMGAFVPSGAAISGEPRAVTYRRTATLTVRGPGITHYKYSVNNPAGPWSSERAVALPIVLTGLVNGQSYTVYAIGKNSAGVWQSEKNPTVSHTWTVNTSHSVLLINEILAHTHGADPDIIELYYDGPSSIDLTGMSMTDDPRDPAKFVFSSSRVSDTTMSPGEYMLLFGSLNTTINHLGFALSADGEALYLYGKPKPDGSGDLIDSVKFGPQINDYSIGRVGWGREWRLNRMTFGSANKPQALGDPDTLKINEWLADGQVLFDDDFVELYNPHPLPVSLGGLYMTDNPVTQPDKHRIADLSFVAPAGYTVFRVNDGNDPSELDFKLSADGEMIGLFDAESNMIDQVLYGPQTTDVSQGRLPDGSSDFEFFDLPTPGVSNPSGADPYVDDRKVLEGLRITELMYNAADGSNYDYIELHNIGTEAIQLGGVRFVDGIEFEFPSKAVNPGQFVVVVSSLTAFRALYGYTADVAGVYTGGLDGGGEDIVLTLAWPLEAAVMRFGYSDQWYPTTDGGGDSLHINDATSHPSTWNDAESWHAASPSPGLP